MAKLLPWVMMPNEWINDGRLKQFSWNRAEGSNNVAALMVLAPMLHHAERTSGLGRLTYDGLELAASLSRHKISAALSVLESREIIEREPQGRSTYQIVNYNPAFGWAKFPAFRLYRDGTITFFEELNLRKRVELDALKLWYFLAARRDNDVNLAKATYDQIAEATGIARERIKSGMSLLAANGLIHVEHIPSRHSEYGVANAYRLPQIDASRHMGTVGRSITEFDEAF